jgi:hypothetical protein
VAVAVEHNHPLGVIWDARATERPRRHGDELRFALAPRAVAGALLVSAVASALAPPMAALADQQPVINLPPNPGGEDPGDDDVPSGQPAPEDQPEPPDP